MARFRYDQVDNYSSQGGAEFFRLADDMDVARVRFMYDSVDEVEGVTVHEVEVNGKPRLINCLREYNQPVDVCPFCRERKFTVTKLFIPLYLTESKEVKIWERGRTFFKKISGLCSRYPNIVSNVFEIERHGAAKDMSTTYEIYHQSEDNITMKDLPKPPEIFGRYVLNKTAEDMEYYLQEGQFPPEDSEVVERGNEVVHRERGNSEGRRTPANRRREAF